jgi:hypothetical protein
VAERLEITLISPGPWFTYRPLDVVLQVLIAGAGPASLEAALALRDLAAIASTSPRSLPRTSCQQW